jgi:hypothetical protein
VQQDGGLDGPGGWLGPEAGWAGRAEPEEEEEEEEGSVATTVASDGVWDFDAILSDHALQLGRR